jgi:hypothetical protein
VGVEGRDFDWRRKKEKRKKENGYHIMKSNQEKQSKGRNSKTYSY